MESLAMMTSLSVEAHVGHSLGGIPPAAPEDEDAYRGS